MDNGRNRHADHLGINRISRNIRKSPPLAQAFQNPNLHQNQPQNQIQPPQPQVYNISKNDFRSVVQQLTGTPTRDPFPGAGPPPAAAAPRPKVPSMRLQKIRPPPLNPIARPPAPHPGHANPSFYRPVAAPPPQIPFSAAPPNGAFWRANLESPTTAYMRYLESSINGDGTPQAATAPPHQQPAAASGILPNPHVGNSSGLLPSPSSQLFMASPTAFMNLSPFPLLSPKFQYPPLSPGFQFSPLPGQTGILGPAPGPPGSPLLFPPSPSGFLLSPRWRDL